MLREIITAVMGIAIIAACFILIFTQRGDQAQAWLMIGVVATYFFNKAQQSSTVDQVLRSQPTPPTITTTTGPPPETRIEPGAPKPE